MEENFIIMERKDMGGESIVAIRESLYHEGINCAYEKKGVASGLANADFRKHNHWGFNYLPIQVVGSIQEPNDIVKASVQKSLENLCQTQGIKFDQERLLVNSELALQILDYEIVEGNLYIVRFIGKNLINGTYFKRSIACFLGPQDGEIYINNKEILLKNKQLELKDFEFITEPDDFKGSLKAFKAGSISLHRKNLRPYISRGTFGGPHSNGPWIVLENDMDSIAKSIGV